MTQQLMWDEIACEAARSLGDVHQDVTLVLELMDSKCSAGDDPGVHADRDEAARHFGQAQELIDWARHTLRAGVARAGGVADAPFPGEFKPLTYGVLQLLALRLIRDRGGSVTIRVQDLLDQLGDSTWSIVARKGPGDDEGTWAVETIPATDEIGGHHG